MVVLKIEFMLLNVQCNFISILLLYKSALMQTQETFKRLNLRNLSPRMEFCDGNRKFRTFVLRIGNMCMYQSFGVCILEPSTMSNNNRSRN